MSFTVARVLTVSLTLAVVLAWDHLDESWRGAPGVAALAQTRAAESSADASIVPFEIRVPDAELADLQERLADTRFPDEILGSGWEYGPDLAYMKELVAYWRDEFDWREQERRLNRFDQFMTNIDGLDIHFIHQRSHDPNARPLILLHGWGGSFYELTKLIDPLTNPVEHGGRPENAFHVVVPSIPGYGFSDHPREQGWGAGRIAQVMVTLMARLGYTRYAVQGGDIGTGISAQMAIHDRDRVFGIHINLCSSGAPRGVSDPNDGVPPAELERMRARQAAYADDLTHIQANRTKAQTIGYGLNDSPVGLAGWFMEKYRRYCDCDGHPENGFTKDELLTFVSMYWFPKAGASAARYYRDSRGGSRNDRVEVPTACAIFPKEVLYTPRRWNEARYNLTRWTEMPRGGHYAAFEEPELMVEDIRGFFRELR